MPEGSCDDAENDPDQHVIEHSAGNCKAGCEEHHFRIKSEELRSNVERLAHKSSLHRSNREDSVDDGGKRYECKRSAGSGDSRREIPAQKTDGKAHQKECESQCFA